MWGAMQSHQMWFGDSAINPAAMGYILNLNPIPDASTPTALHGLSKNSVLCVFFTNDAEFGTTSRGFQIAVNLVKLFEITQENNLSESETQNTKELRKDIMSLSCTFSLWCARSLAGLLCLLL